MHFETHDTLIDETQEVSSEAARTTDFHVQPNDLLELPMAQRMVIQYRPTAEARELCLYYGAREISFDDPDMFAFGETLGRQTRFVAQDAIQWGSGYAWTRVSPCSTNCFRQAFCVARPASRKRLSSARIANALRRFLRHIAKGHEAGAKPKRSRMN